MIFCWFSDVHLADVAPASRKDESYSDVVIEKLLFIAQTCLKVNAEYAVFGGDLFHSKIASKISHGLVNKILKVLDEFPCPILFIVGSHDISYGRLETINKRPIGTILKHPMVRFLEEPYIINPDFEIVDEDTELLIRVLPLSDTYNKTDEVLNKIKEYKKSSAINSFTGKYYDIALLHQPIVKDKKVYPYEVIPADDLAGEFDLGLIAHMHDDKGIWESTLNNKTTTFAQVGSVSRTSIDDKGRKPKFLLFDVTNKNKKISLSYKEVEIPVVEDVFKEESSDNKIDESIKTLLDNVNETSFGIFSTEEAIKAIGEEILFEAYNPEIDPASEDQALEFYHAVKEKAVEILEKVKG
jgi:DNA repair exonuclease SbcCD nuclease subunit